MSQLPQQLGLLRGWGRTAPTAARVQQPRCAGQVTEALAAGDARGVIARGLGRSYGDAAQNAGGLVLDTTGLDRVRELDLAGGTVTVEAGVSLDRLLRVLVPLGWFVRVTPGTGYVTVGGAIASDVHGKNHHADGGFCQWVARFTLATPTGIFEVDPSSQPEVFWATAGGMGLTGVVTQATLRLLPISTASMAIRTDRTPDLDGALELLSADDGHYSVAWIDLLARGAGTGRAVVTRGRHAHPDELPAGRDPAGREPAGRDRTGGHRLAYAPSRRLSAPPWVPGGLLNTTTVRAFNEIWYRKAPRAQHGLQSLQGFFHPLDGIGGWNRVYGRHGFVQYQFVVPISGLEVLRGAVELFAHDRVPGFLAVLKRLGPQPGLLSFPLAGWTLALDIPRATPGLAGLLDRLDEQVAEAGGRVYLTKDARLRPDVLAVMYPALERWRAIQAELDPGGVLRSDLSRRLGLLPPPPKAADGH